MIEHRNPVESTKGSAHRSTSVSAVAVLYRDCRGVDLVKDVRIQLSAEATLVLKHNITYSTGHERVFYLRTPDMLLLWRRSRLKILLKHTGDPVYLVRAILAQEG